MSLFSNILSEAIDALPSTADLQRGYFELEAEIDACKQAIRLTCPSPDLVKNALAAYAETENIREIIEPFLPPQFRTAAFFAALAPDVLRQLGNAACALAVGPDVLKKLLRNRTSAIADGGQAAN